ncbi:MAG: hypothetical protein HQ504_06535 [Rhodospirillaceae bacterium]|nr:hypothetical protein [Rhodospirillaceae bacterium]
MTHYHRLTRSNDYFSPMSEAERQRHEINLGPSPLDDLISTATLKMINAVERGWKHLHL